MSLKKTFKARVYYYDTDHMGVVYHANYLKWMEIARSEYFREVLPYKKIEDMGFLLPVKNLNIEYIDSAKYDDEIEIVVEVKKINNIKIEFYYEIYDQNKKLKAKANTTNVFIDKDGNLKRISKEILDILKG